MHSRILQLRNLMLDLLGLGGDVCNLNLVRLFILIVLSFLLSDLQEGQ